MRIHLASYFLDTSSITSATDSSGLQSLKVLEISASPVNKNHKNALKLYTDI